MPWKKVCQITLDAKKKPTSWSGGPVSKLDAADGSGAVRKFMNTNWKKYTEVVEHCPVLDISQDAGNGLFRLLVNPPAKPAKETAKDIEKAFKGLAPKLKKIIIDQTGAEREDVVDDGIVLDEDAPPQQQPPGWQSATPSPTARPEGTPVIGGGRTPTRPPTQPPPQPPGWQSATPSPTAPPQSQPLGGKPALDLGNELLKVYKDAVAANLTLSNTLDSKRNAILTSIKTNKIDQGRIELEALKVALQQYKVELESLRQELTGVVPASPKLKSDQDVIRSLLDTNQPDAARSQLGPWKARAELTNRLNALGTPPPELVGLHANILAQIDQGAMGAADVAFNEYAAVLAELPIKVQYEKRRLAATPLLNNAKVQDESRSLATAGISTMDNMAGAFKFKSALDELNKLLAAVQKTLETGATKIRADVREAQNSIAFTDVELTASEYKLSTEAMDAVKLWDLKNGRVKLQAYLDAIVRAKREAAKPAQDYLGDLSKVQSVHAKAQLQNASFARNTEQARSAAVRIIMPNGEFDPGFMADMPFARQGTVSQLRDEVAGGKDADLPQSKHAVKMLSTLESKEDMRAMVMSIGAPTNKTAGDLVRATLGLPPDVVVTEVHARQAAVCGLLSQLRQSDVGSCFATSVAIEAQDKNPKLFLADMKTMLTEGCIKRTVDGKEVKTPINQDMSTSSLGKVVGVPKDDNNLHATPSFGAALEAMGVPEGDRKQAMADACAALRLAKGIAPTDAEAELTPDEIMKQIIKARKGTKTDPQVLEETTAATNAYLAQEDNRLLRGWEYTVASMAELDDERGQAIRKDGADAATAGIEPVINGLLRANKTNLPEAQAFFDGFQAKFEAAYKNAVTVTYDASVETAPAADGNSSRGVWVMQRKDDKTKVTDAAQQNKLIKDVIASMASQYPGVNEQKLFADVLAGVQTAPLTTTDPPQPSGATTMGIVTLLNAFHGVNKKLTHADVDETVPADGNELFKWLLTRQQSMKDKISGPVATNPEGASLPIWNGPHAFSLKPGNPLLMAAANGRLPGEPDTAPAKTPTQLVAAHCNAEKSKNTRPADHQGHADARKDRAGQGPGAYGFQRQQGLVGVHREKIGILP